MADVAMRPNPSGAKPTWSETRTTSYPDDIHPDLVSLCRVRPPAPSNDAPPFCSHGTSGYIKLRPSAALPPPLPTNFHPPPKSSLPCPSGELHHPEGRPLTGHRFSPPGALLSCISRCAAAGFVRRRCFNVTSRQNLAAFAGDKHNSYRSPAK
ncbi:hypothetical protein NA56DRAFT_697222 [Hyaloscypha hepaticicola]|uniref:Uncharacterized protein n=1 Tax=Hyaloscypha hepaticicola TaxID=2082293 RepID=A0A2J6QLC8_9HELO|nr:hypothetical protein NA56DRAFT_697222 [Hyaloscypha hepaticicola]